MKAKIKTCICVLVISLAAFAQQKNAEPVKAAGSDSLQAIINSDSPQKNLSKQVAIYRPKTMTNWSKIKDLFK